MASTWATLRNFYLSKWLFIESKHNQCRYLVLGVVHFVSRRRVLAVRDLIGVRVVGRAVLATPFLNNGRQDSPSRARRHEINVRYRVRSSLEVLVERTSIAAVVEDLRVVARCISVMANVVAGLLADKIEYVGADIEAAQSVEVPVCFDGADFGIVVVPVLVGGSDELLRDGVAEHQAEDAVALGVSLAFVKCDEDEGTAPEAGLFVVDQWLEEIAAPFSGDGNRGIVSIACLFAC
jgi:hypothetical protein